MATLPDLRSLAHFQEETGGETLTLPIGGREYTWDAGKLSMRAFLRLQQARTEIARIEKAVAAGQEVDPRQELLPGVSEAEFELDLMGEQRQKMIDDGVTVAEIQFVGIVLFAWHLYGRATAEAMWRGQATEVVPDPPARKPTTRRGSTAARKPSAGRKSSPTGRSSKPRSTPTTKST